MTLHILGTYSRLLGIVVVTAVLSVSVLSTIHFGMGISSVEAMGDCPFASTQGLCSMDDPLGHTSVWSGLRAIFSLSIITFLFVIATTSFLSLSSLRVLFELLYSFVRVRLRYLPYARSYPARLLAEAFSNGILNPKLF